MSIVSAHLQTESGDNYHMLYTDILSAVDFVDRIESELGDELGYVFGHSVLTVGLEEGRLTRLLQRRIEELQE